MFWKSAGINYFPRKQDVDLNKSDCISILHTLFNNKVLSGFKKSFEHKKVIKIFLVCPFFLNKTPPTPKSNHRNKKVLPKK